MDLGSALLALLTGLIVKGAVMVLAGVLLVRLYRATHDAPPRRLWLLLPDQDRPAVRVLWWALVLFALSELTCGVEVYVLFRSSLVLSSIHGLASAAGMALFALGVVMHVDERFLRFAAPRCLVNRVCRGCTLTTPAGCRFRTLLLLLATLVALACLVPPLAPVERMDVDLSRYTLPFPALNAWYDETVVPWLAARIPGHEPGRPAYYIPSGVLVLEYRLLPALAFATAAAAIVAIRRGALRAGLRILAVAAGALAYVYFELVLYAATRDVLLGSLAHEVAEFWFLLATAEFLRRSFPAPAAGPAPPAQVTA